MTLKNILELVNEYDKISIHTGSGFVIFDGEVNRLSHPVTQRILAKHLEDKVDQIRPYHDTLVILLTDKEDK